MRRTVHSAKVKIVGPPEVVRSARSPCALPHRVILATDSDNLVEADASPTPVVRPPWAPTAAGKLPGSPGPMTTVRAAASDNLVAVTPVGHALMLRMDWGRARSVAPAPTELLNLPRIPPSSQKRAGNQPAD